MESKAYRSEILAMTPRSAAAIAQSPNSGSARVLKTPLTDEVIWKRLKESGFDEDSIKRRDKASLVAYIAKLEAEVYDHQHQMGLLILEKKEWLSKYEEAKSAADSSELKFKCARASHTSDLANAKKREENLKKALGIEKECIKNIEKTLHEMRTEYAEVKVSAESKFSEARNMVADAVMKITEAEEKKRAAESLEAEASLYHRTAERKLHEVEEREDVLRRHIVSSKSDFEAKEKEIEHERKSLSERQKVVQQTHERLLDGQALLNQREDYIFNRTQELKRFEKELEDLRLAIDKERISVNEEKASVELNASLLSGREEAVIKREYDLLKKEEEVLLLQAKISTREYDNAQQAMSNNQATLVVKNSNFEAEAEMMRKLLDDEFNSKRRDWELRELDIKQREDFISEREREADVKSMRLEEYKKEAEDMLILVEKKEKSLLATEEELELKKKSFDQEKEELMQSKLNLKKLSDLLVVKEKHITDAEEKANATRKETSELLALEVRLKEEIDIISAQKQELEGEADHLRAEKAKFEAEWELIDAKREKLVKEDERISEERSTASKILKDERASLKAEKEALRDQYKQNLESLARDREAFMTELEDERVKWFGKIQKEHAEFLFDIEMQKKEADCCIENRREEIENILRERENEFEEERKRELQNIASLKESVGKELEHVNSEMKRLDDERREIALDRERRDQEWSELNNAIEELKVQREKLEKQRELLRADREEILAQIEILRDLEGMKERLDSITAREMLQSNLQSNHRKTSKRYTSQQTVAVLDQCSIDNGLDHNSASCVKESDKLSSPLSAPFSWLKRCADTLLEQRQNHKKMRKDNDSTTHGSEDSTPCTPLKYSSTFNIEEVVAPSIQSPPGVETTVYIDKIVTVEEVTRIDVERAMGDSKEAALKHDDQNVHNYDEVEIEIN